MPTPLPITIVAGTLPAGAVYNAQTYFNAIVERMTATVAGGNVVWGQLGGSRPAGPLPGSDSQAGLWFGNPTGGKGYWNDYNTDAALYLPIAMMSGQYVNGTLRTCEIICGAVAANRTITTPDASGVMAITSDIIQALGTQSLPGTGTQTVDWAAPNPPIYIVQTANMTINNINTRDGMIVDFWFENATGASTFTVNFPGVAFASGGVQLTGLSPGAAGQRVIDHLRIHRAGGYLFGEVISQNHRIAGGSDTTLPAPVSASATDNNTIAITMNAVLQGNNALAISGFAVLVNGAADPIVSASCSGTTVTVNVANNMGANATVTIRYLGTDMKSLAGNVVPVFGPINVLGVRGGGIHNDPDTGPTGIEMNPP